jgi:hypothetical protein
VPADIRRVDGTLCRKHPCLLYIHVRAELLVMCCVHSGDMCQLVHQHEQVCNDMDDCVGKLRRGNITAVLNYRMLLQVCAPCAATCLGVL